MKTLPALIASIGTGVLASIDCVGQTPEQQQMWAAQQAEALAAEKINAERLSQERAARRADPMAWVRTLSPMTAGGWEFRAVATDGSWATYSTNHQMKRSGKLATIWLRQEYAEPQVNGNSRYSSVVQKIQYDCAKEKSRPLLMVYYAENNLQGGEDTEESDSKATPWSAIVPGTRDEFDFLWACDAERSSSQNR